MGAPSANFMEQLEPKQKTNVTSGSPVNFVEILSQILLILIVFIVPGLTILMVRYKQVFNYRYHIFRDTLFCLNVKKH